MRVLLGCLAALALGGCATGFYHVAAGGVRVDKDLEVLKKFEVDKAICQGEASKAALSAGAQAYAIGTNTELVMRGCMAQRGYVVR